jgi:DUF177 domain-containing protein
MSAPKPGDSAPKLGDVRKLADARAVVELDIPLQELPGFSPEYLTGGAHVHARLSFGREQGRAMAQVALQAQLSAICQRCLGAMPVRIDTSSPVLIVESEQEAEAAPAGWETFLAPEGRLRLAALAAEELLLALPIVPLHEDARQCQPLAPVLSATGAAHDASAQHAAPAGAAAAADAGKAGREADADEQALVRPFAELRSLLERSGKREG